MMRNQGGTVNASGGSYDNANFNSSKFTDTIINVIEDDKFLVKELMSDILGIFAFYGVVFSMFDTLKKSVGVDNCKLYQHYGTVIVVVGGLIVGIVMLLKCYFSIKKVYAASASKDVESPPGRQDQDDGRNQNPPLNQSESNPTVSTESNDNQNAPRNENEVNEETGDESNPNPNPTVSTESNDNQNAPRNENEDTGDANVRTHVQSRNETNGQPNRKQGSWRAQMKRRSLYCKIMFLITPIILYVLVGVFLLLYFWIPKCGMHDSVKQKHATSVNYFPPPQPQPQPEDASEPSTAALMLSMISAYVLLTIALIL